MAVKDRTYLLKRILSVFFLVFVVMLFISKDSYMHDLPNHNDSAWFFMCGKAWMNGMVPYVDFADSKGPLLWLVYGVGYLLAPHSYLGVFWLSCIAWTLTLSLAWSGAALLLRKGAASFVAMLPVMLAGLCFLVHNETRCEDFAMPFVAFVVYALCRAMRGLRWKWWVDFMLGVSLMGTLLMKYNITAMILPFVLLVWAVAQRRSKAQPARSAVLCGLGAAVVAVPFVAWFAQKGCLDGFLNEYFLVTLRTTGSTGLFSATLHSIASPSGVYALVAVVLSALCLAWLLPCCRRMALACCVWFFVVCAINSRPYYFDICSPLLLFLGVVVTDRCKALHGRRTAVAAGVMAVAFLIVSNLWVHDLRHAEYGDFFTQDNAARRQYYSVECMMAQVPEARAVYATGVGFGVASGVLPACKYWALQCGFNDSMLRQQIDACLTGKADFAVVQPELDEVVGTLKRAGWHAYDFTDGPYKVMLMSSRRLSVRHGSCRMTNWDVLLKRQPAFCRNAINEQQKQ